MKLDDLGGGGAKTRKRMNAFDKAARLLTARRHTGAELRRKLAQRKYSSQEIEEALKRLAELGWIDDRTVAFDWAQELANRGGMGRLRAEQKLIRRGLPPELVREALASNWDDAVERGHALRVLAKLSASGPSAGKKPGKLYQALSRRGFDLGIIRDLLLNLDDPDHGCNE